MLELKNPHSVLAALACRPHDVFELRFSGGPPTGAWADVVTAAEAHGIPMGQAREGGRRQSRQSGKSERIGTASAIVREHPGVPAAEALFATVQTGDAGPGLWLGLDCLQDPHNVGAIFRTAAFFGVRGILVTRDRSAPMNGTVYDVSAGGVEHVPFCVVPNLARGMDQARAAGLWLLGASEHAELSFEEIGPDRPWLLMIGNEEKGLRRLTLDACDQVCAIRPRGGVTSLNASVAAALMIGKLSTAPPTA